MARNLVTFCRARKLITMFKKAINLVYFYITSGISKINSV